MARTQEEETSGTIKVKVAPLFGEVKEFVLPEDSTVEKLLEISGNNSNSEVRVITEDGEDQGVVGPSSLLDDGDVVSIVAKGKVEAGR
jgi:hypothetical protein